MAGLIDKPETREAAPPLPPVPEEVRAPDDASRLCVNCASLLAEGQDWCLECGTAQPGRLGGRDGWRPALAIVAVTALLAVGAVAAGYAALSSDPERQASAPAPPSAQPVVPPAPVATTPAPAETTPSVPAPAADDPAPPADDGAGDPAPAPSADSGDTAPAPSGGSSSGSTDAGGDTGGSSGGGGASEPAKRPSPIVALSPGAASTFDPFGRAGGLTGDPADAIDGRRGTSWEAPSAAEDGRVDIGLLVSLDSARAIDNVRLRAGTPGFSVELYGATLGTPPDAAPGDSSYWKKLDTTRDFGTDERLDAGGGKLRHVLLWVTEQPADTKVMISEVELYK